MWQHYPEKLAELPLLHHTTRPDEWGQWFQQMKKVVPFAKVGQRIELFSMLIQTAKAGLGVALVPYHFIERDIAKPILFDTPARRI